MESRLIFRRNEVDSFILMFLMVMSSSFVSYDYYNFFKSLLLVFSFIIILKYWDWRLVFSEKKLIAFSAYVLFLVAFFLREVDDFSLRLLFNLIVTVACAAAAISAGLYRRHIAFFLPIVVLFSLYNYFFNINFYDGKPQVHAQIFTLVVLCAITQGFYKSKIANIIVLMIVLLSKVRSVLFGILPVILLNLSTLGGRWREVANFTIVMCACVAFYLIYNNFDTLHFLLGDSLNSMNWRFYHWANLFDGISDEQMLFGNGLGHSWRITLFIDDFYTDGENYVAAHSNYVKIISETGFFGLIVFISIMAFFYKNSSLAIKSLIVFYIGYGFYDEGVWLYSVFWTLLLVSEKAYRND